MVADPAPPTKGPGLLLRLYHESSNSNLPSVPLNVPDANIIQLTNLSSDDDKSAIGVPNLCQAYEVRHISKLLTGDAYANDVSRSQNTEGSVDWQVYKLISTKSRPGHEKQNELGATVVCVGITPKDGAYNEYAKWFEEEHVELISLVPGWIRSSRYELAKSYGDPKVVAPYMAMHFYDEVNGLGGAEWQRSIDTEWTLKVRKDCKVPHFRRIWKVLDQGEPSTI